MRPIKIVSCTQKANYRETELYRSIIDLQEYTNNSFKDIHFFTKNKRGLSTCYNEYLTSADEDDIIIFVHDDVYIEDGMIHHKLQHYHETYNIIGVAGGTNLTIKKPALWHIMCGGFGPNLRGFAGHFVRDSKQKFITNFGPTPERVIVVDGLFISVDVRSAKNVNWSFNQNYEFHHYDIASCLDANKKKLKIGVVPIWVTHHSHGLREYDSVFTASQEKFIEEYKGY